METPEIVEIVLEAMRNVNMARSPEERLLVAPEAPIFGRDSSLDSLGLVALLMDIEEAFEQRGHPIVLSDERAMSQAHSPFRSVPRLVEYISSVCLDGHTAPPPANQ